MNADSTRVRLDIEHVDEMVDAARSGDLTLAREERQILRASRGTLLQELRKRPADDSERETLKELVQESRASERELADLVRAAQDDRHAERMADLTQASNAISERMTELAEASNTIAERAEATAGKLKTWTVALVVATVVLALATVFLAWATFEIARTDRKDAPATSLGARLDEGPRILNPLPCF